jgi:hypothetical protein
VAAGGWGQVCVECRNDRCDPQQRCHLHTGGGSPCDDGSCGSRELGAGLC